MKITIESTEKMTFVNGTQARVWKGISEPDGRPRASGSRRVDGAQRRSRDAHRAAVEGGELMLRRLLCRLGFHRPYPGVNTKSYFTWSCAHCPARLPGDLSLEKRR